MNPSTAADPGAGPALEVVPLGGLGEFGMNMMAVVLGRTPPSSSTPASCFRIPSCSAWTWSFPISRISQQRARRSAALVLTHGHEDHIGAVPYVLPLPRRPGVRHAADAGARRAEARRARHRARRPAGRRSSRADDCGGRPSTVEFIRVTHSIPDCVALAIHTPAGIDRPHGRLQDRPDAARRRSTSTCTASRSSAAPACSRCSPTAPTSTATDSPGRRSTSSTPFEEIFACATGRLVVTTFASSIYRMQILVDLAAQFDRKVAFVGRGMLRERRRSRSGSATCASPPA